MSGPAAGAGDHEDGREHRGRNAHAVIGDRREPIQVREHFPLPHHDRLNAIGDLEHLHVTHCLGQASRHFLDHLVARIRNRVDRVPEADDDFLVAHSRDDVVFRLVGRVVAVHHLEADLVGAAVLGSLERTDRAGDRRVHVGAGAGDDASRKGGRIELVLSIEIERGMHCANPVRLARSSMQQVQEMPADRVVFGLDIDAASAVRVVIPVEQHRPERGHQSVGDVARAGDVVILLLRQGGAQGRAAGPHDVHRMGARGHLLQHAQHRPRQPAQAHELRLVAAQLRSRGEFSVHQQVGDFLELALLRDVENIVAAIVQVIAAAPDGAQGGAAGLHTRQRDRLLGLESGGRFAHTYPRDR